MTASEAWLGPVHTMLYEPAIASSSAPTTFGIQRTTVTGMTEWVKAHQLRELTLNPARRITAGGQTGVLEVVWFEDDLLGPLSGWALLQSFDLGQADVSHSLYDRRQGLVPYTLTLAVIGSRTPVVTHSARDRDYDYSVTPKALLVSPFWNDGAAFTTPPAGAPFTAEYDPTSAYEWTDPVVDAAEATLYESAVTSATAIYLPSVEQSFEDGPPRWVTDRGGDCRAYDRRQTSEVYGPHHFVDATDLMVNNGRVRAWVGNRGLVPFLNVEAYRSGEWRQVGVLQFGNIAVLTRARLLYVTPERVTVALTAQNYGDITVTLRRGARALDWFIPHASLDPSWKGTPPTLPSSSASVGAGRFGTGLAGGRDDVTWDDPVGTWDDVSGSWGGDYPLPSIQFLWPPKQAQTEWSKVVWLRPYKDIADTDGSGYLTIRHADGSRAGVVWLASDGTLRFAVGATTIQVGPIDFNAGDDICIGARFSTTHGMALSVSADAVRHVANTAATTPASATSIRDWAYYKNDASWGDDDWGDGVWGGDTSYPDAVIDNDMTFDRWLTDGQFEALATTAAPLDGIDDIGDLVHYLPFDVTPVQTMGARSAAGLRLGSVDSWGLQRAITYLTPTSGAAALTTSDTYDTPAAIQAQVAAEDFQEVRLRA